MKSPVFLFLAAFMILSPHTLRAASCEQYEKAWRSSFLSAKPQNEAHFMALTARCYADRGDRKKALSYYKRAIATFEGANLTDIILGRAYYDYADFLDRIGLEDEAIAARKRWKELVAKYE